jgi:hypothetical protein
MLRNNNKFKILIIPSNILSLSFPAIAYKYLVPIVLDC